MNYNLKIFDTCFDCFLLKIKELKISKDFIRNGRTGILDN